MHTVEALGDQPVQFQLLQVEQIEEQEDANGGAGASVTGSVVAHFFRPTPCLVLVDRMVSVLQPVTPGHDLVLRS